MAARKVLAVFVSVVLVMGLMPGFVAWGDLEANAANETHEYELNWVWRLNDSNYPNPSTEVSTNQLENVALKPGDKIKFEVSCVNNVSGVSVQTVTLKDKDISTDLYASNAYAKKSMNHYSYSFTIPQDSGTYYFDSVDGSRVYLTHTPPPTLTLDPNKGVGGWTQMGKKVTITPPSTDPIREKYSFSGWNTKESPADYGSNDSVHYANGDTVDLTSDTTLYAEWTRKATIDVGSHADGSPAVAVFYYGDNENGYYNRTIDTSVRVSLAPKSGWEAVGWTTDGSKTTADNAASFDLAGTDLKAEETTYYALVKRDVSLSYNANGADAATADVPNSKSYTQIVNASGNAGSLTVVLADQPANLVKEGCVFGGWDIDGTTYQPGDTYTWADDGAADVTATAVWVGEVSVTPPTLADDLVYNGADQVLLSAGGTSNAGTVVYSLSRNGDYADAIPTGKDAGSYTVWYKAVDANGRALSNPASVTATIGKAPVRVAATAATKVYGEADPTFDFTVEGLIAPDTKASMTGALSRISGEDVGDHAITVGSLSAGKNYNISFTGANLTITKAQLTVKANDNTITYGDAPTNKGATFTGLVNGDTAASLGALTYTYSYTQFGDIGDNYTITPSGLTSGNYDITYQNGTLKVEQREVTLVWASPSQFTYTGNDIPWPAPAVGNTVSDDALTAEWASGAVSTAKDADTYAPVVDNLVDATAGADKAKNYKLPANTTGSWSIKKPATNAMTVSIAGWTYGKTPNEPVVTADFGTAQFTYYKDDGSEVTGADLENGKPKNAGDYWVKATIDGTDNYPAAEATCPFTISKANITVTADDQQSVRTNDTTAQASLSCTITGDLVASDETDLKATYVEATPVDTVNLCKTGSYALKAYWKTGKTEHPNYNVTFMGGTYTVTRALASVTATGYTGTYDGVADNEKITVTVTDAASGTQFGGSGTGTITKYYSTEDFQTSLGLTSTQINALKEDDITTTAFQDAWTALQSALADKSTTSPAYVNASDEPYTVYFMIVSDQVMPDVIFGSKDVVINKAPLTVMANDKRSITYGDDAPSEGPGVTYAGLVDADKEDDAPKAGVIKNDVSYDYGGYKAGEPVGNYAITPSGFSADNYDITYVPGTLVVEKRELALEWRTPKALVYNGASQDYAGAKAINLYGSDEVSVDLTAGTGTAKDVGSYTATVAGLSGNKASNYKLPTTNLSGPWSITPADLIVRAKDKTITYGDAPADNGVRYESPEGTEIDEPALGGALSFTFNSYVRYGDAKSYADEIVPSGLTSPNYNITFKPGELTVEPRELELIWSADDAFDYTGEVLTYDKPTLSGIVNGDDVSVGGYARNTATDAGTYTAVVESLDGAKKDNYVLPDNRSHDWTIRGVENSGKVEIEDWTYGDKPATPQVTAEFGAETATFAYFTDEECTSPVADDSLDADGMPKYAGTYWVKATIPAKSYEGVTATAKFNIAKRKATVTAADQVVEIGGSIDASVGKAVLSNAAAGDALSAVTLTATSTAAATTEGTITPSAAEIKAAGADMTENYEITYVPGKLLVVGASATENGKLIYTMAKDVWLTVQEAAALLASPDAEAQMVKLADVRAQDTATGAALDGVQVADRGGLAAVVGEYKVTFKVNPEVQVTFHVTDSTSGGDGKGGNAGTGGGDGNGSGGTSATKPDSTRKAASPRHRRRRARGAAGRYGPSRCLRPRLRLAPPRKRPARQARPQVTFRVNLARPA